MTLSVQTIVHELQQQKRRSFSVQELLTSLPVPASQRRGVLKILEALAVEGLLKPLRKGRYQVRNELTVVEGGLHLQSRGHGFLRYDEQQEDVYVAAHRLTGAMNDDRVAALLLPASAGRRREGLVIEVLQRAHNTALGRCQRHKHSGALMLESEPDGLTFEVLTTADFPAPEGQVVVLAIDRYPLPGLPGLGRVIEVFGPPGAADVDIRIAAYRQGLPLEFSAAARREAQRVAVPVSVADYVGREDLCVVPLVTIDGADARDFDDAVALKKTANGWTLWVAIADVSHYVRPDSVLDVEARERGTSVYFPGSCLPMLPESLSNGICSLNPGVERLVLAVELALDATAIQHSMRVFPAVMRSHARLTYDEVQQHLDGEQRLENAQIGAMLEQMQSLALLLHEKRRQRGALDFDLPEADILLSEQGLPLAIARRSRLASHRLIEEFMLAANEAVAAWVLARRSTAMFRVHAAPDYQALQLLQQFVARFNIGFNLDETGIEPRQLQKLLAQIAGTAQEYLVNRVLLRSMKQACYAAENEGHFGLASEAYCHFTSPIRRYPDLMQHRIVLKLLAGDARWPNESLAALAEHLTATERRAMQAERDIVDLRKCQFMLDKIGRRYTGYITSVTAFGFFVELDDFFVEGLVHIRTLGDDYYRYDDEQHSLIGQGRRRIFQIGMAVTIEVWQVRPLVREIDFILPQSGAAPSSLRRSGNRPSGKRGAGRSQGKIRHRRPEPGLSRRQ